MKGLAASQLVVRRDKRTVLGGIDAYFAGGTFTAVIGPNGAGKSTLLSVLAGLLQPDGGRVLLDDADLRTFKPAELARRRGYLPQNPRVEWPISVERVVSLGLMPNLPMFGALAMADVAALERALDACDLAGLRNRPATALSGGELARVMLARAIVGDPEVLIVDEPTAGLDPRHAIDACRRLRMHADTGRTVIVAVHDLALAARFADQVLALRGGCVVGAGTTDEVLQDAALSRLFDVQVRVQRLDGTTSIYFQ